MTPERIISSNKQNIVFIGFKKKQEDNQYAVAINGSGFIVDEEYVVTCAHVYNQCPEGVEIFAGVFDSTNGNVDVYKTDNVSLVGKDDVRDVAILKLTNRRSFGFSTDDLMTDQSKLKAGKEVLFLGFPLANDFIKLGVGVTLFANKCIIGAIKYSSSDDKIDFIQIDSHVNPSNSGSPLFDVESGKIVGLTTGTFNQSIKQQELIQIPRNMGIVKPSIYIKDLLEESLSKK